MIRDYLPQSRSAQIGLALAVIAVFSTLIAYICIYHATAVNPFTDELQEAEQQKEDLREEFDAHQSKWGDGDHFRSARLSEYAEIHHKRRLFKAAHKFIMDVGVTSSLVALLSGFGSIVILLAGNLKEGSS